MKIDLIKAYLEANSLKELDMPLPEDKRKAIKKMEKQFVNRDVIPFITSMLTPIFEGVQTKISIEIVYDPGAGLSVNKKDKKQKAQEVKAVQLDPTIEEEVAEESSTKDLLYEEESTFDNIFFIKSGVVDASLKYELGQYILLKGSKVKGGETSFRPEKRREILHKCALYRGDYWEVIHDYKFDSPSTLAGFCLGRSANGWIEAKDKHGRTMDERLRNKD